MNLFFKRFLRAHCRPPPKTNRKQVFGLGFFFNVSGCNCPAIQTYCIDKLSVAMVILYYVQNKHCDGEDSTRFLNGNFNLLWESGCVNIFVNYKTNCEVQIFDDYFTVLDWYGYNHFYDENGELTSVYCPQYDCNKNDGENSA